MRKAVKDGAFDRGQYEKTPVKIVWLLKEPVYDEHKSQSDLLKKAIRNKKLGNTWTNIAYVAHGVISGWSSGIFEKWENIPSVENDVGKSLYSVAVVNVKKTANQKSDGYSDNCEISNAYHEHADAIILQIKDLNPDIVVFGYPKVLRGIVEDVFMRMTGEKYRNVKIGTFSVTICGKFLFIWAYHPSYYLSEEKGKLSKYSYYESFIKSVKLFKKHLDQQNP